MRQFGERGEETRMRKEMLAGWARMKMKTIRTGPVSGSSEGRVLSLSLSHTEKSLKAFLCLLLRLDNFFSAVNC